jgi:hypothetical protein
LNRTLESFFEFRLDHVRADREPHASVRPGNIIDRILAELTGDSDTGDDIIVTCVRWRPET